MESLHYLVRTQRLEDIKRLLTQHSTVQIDEIDEQGMTALFQAVSAPKPSLEIIELLLENGANPNFAHVERLPGFVAPAMKATFFLFRFRWFRKWLGGKRDNFLADLPDIAIPSFAPSEYRESIPYKALGHADLELVKLLQRYGADFTYVDENGYTALIHAACADNDELIEYLIGLGIDVNAKSSYGETALRIAYHHSKYKTVYQLIEAGADESGLEWSSLIRAVAIGNRQDVERELSQTPDFSAVDTWGDSALHVALKKGDQGLAELLLNSGADLHQLRRGNAATISAAVESGNTQLVEWLVAQGCFVDGQSFMEHPVLVDAVESSDLPMVETLLKLGADPNAQDKWSSPLNSASNRNMILCLLAHGADPQNLSSEGSQSLFGFEEITSDILYSVTEQEYHRAKNSRAGIANPEEANEPFYLAMIRCGINAYVARKHFKEESNFSCNINSRGQAVWCADRFGQSFTFLPDGRIVRIGGEHEDHYDPDFCIYNDVIVHEPDGIIRVFLYPYSVFPPTDFHTATLVGDYIYIIGCLGYPDDRNDASTPIYRLNTLSYCIEQFKTSGPGPGRIFEHRANLIGANIIQIEGGTRVTFKKSKEEHFDNDQIYQLDLTTGVWSSINR